MGTFGLVMAAAAAAAVLLMLLLRKKYGVSTKSVLIFGVLAVPLCVLLGRGAFWLCSLDWIRYSDLSFWDFTGTGYTYMLYGAVIGGFAAAFLAAKISGVPFGRLADAAAAPAALTIAAGRFAEYLIDAGFGSGVAEWFDPYEGWSMIAWEDPEPICRFPFAVQNYYGTWRFSINLWEGLAAVVFLIVLLRMKKRRSGGAVVLLLLLYAVCQTIFESMRKDDVIIWHFVKANQLISALLVLGILIFCWLKLPEAKRSIPKLCIRIGLLLLCAGIIMLMEFALDQKIVFLMWMRADLSYMVIAAGCIGMLLTVLPVWRCAWPEQEGL